MHPIERFTGVPLMLEVPIFAQLQDDEAMKLFFAFLYKMGQEQGFKSRYYMQAADVRYLCRRYVTVPTVTFEPFLSHVRVGNISNHVWSFQWTTVPAATGYEMHDPMLCATWGYVLGRLAKDNLVEDWRDGIPEKQDAILNRDERRYFKYTGSKD